MTAAHAPILEALRRVADASPVLAAVAWAYEPVADGEATLVADGRLLRYGPAHVAPLAPAELDFSVAAAILRAGLEADGPEPGRDPALWREACGRLAAALAVREGIGKAPAGALHADVHDRMSVEEACAALDGRRAGSAAGAAPGPRP